MSAAFPSPSASATGCARLRFGRRSSVEQASPQRPQFIYPKPPESPNPLRHDLCSSLTLSRDRFSPSPVRSSCSNRQRSHGSSLPPARASGIARRLDMTYLIYIGVVLFIIALVAWLLGARGVAGMSAGLGRTFLLIGLIVGLVFIVLGLVNR